MKLANPLRSRAILVGVAKYRFLPPLPTTMNNLDDLASSLCDDDLWGLPKSHCAVVRDPDSQERVLHTLYDAVEQAEDTLILYFTGHGLKDADTGELLLGLTGSMQGRAYTTLAYDHIRRALHEARAPRRVVVLDCCYSGQAIAGMSDPASVVVDEVSAEGTFVLAAAPENKQALAPEGEFHTAFTGELIRLIRSGLDDGSEFVSLQQVFTHTRRELIAKSRPRPQMRTRNTIGDLALVRNRQWKQARPAEPPEPPSVTPRSIVSSNSDDEAGNARASTVSNRIVLLIEHLGTSAPIGTVETLKAFGIKHNSVASLAVVVDASIASAIRRAISAQLDDPGLAEVQMALTSGDIRAAAAHLVAVPARRRYGRERSRSFYQEIIDDSRNVVFGLVTQYADWINESDDPMGAWLAISHKHSL
ncbi:caspase domain-containing protein [Nocardia sp. NPDC057668]|uniref:caspase family protein n=1 Tax=Nocardia sp. NPDC057668 TaxID=3346202 RepID=UPI00366B5B99